MSFLGHFNKLLKCSESYVLLLFLFALVLVITPESFAEQDANNFHIGGTLPFGDVPYIWILLDCISSRYQRSYKTSGGP